jgi:hypothetical protein
MFFRTGNVISAEDIRRGIRDGIWAEATTALTGMSEQLADQIMAEIAGGKDFWTAVYEPYSGNHISREVVRLIVDKTRERAGKSMPRIAKYLRAIDSDNPDSGEEQRRFFKFKNFLYKTVKIS